MHKLAYAIALAVALIALPTNAQADDVDPVPHAGPPCPWFRYTLSPPDVQVRPECIDLPVVGNVSGQ